MQTAHSLAFGFFLGAGRSNVALSGQSKTEQAYRILIIEDNRDGRESLRRLLEILGDEVETAADGNEGIAKALTWRPQIAVIDIGLPGLDGLEVARRLRQTFGKNICLIAHTGYNRAEDRRRVIEAGFDIHLVKPVDWEEFHEVLRKDDLCAHPERLPPHRRF
jgi:CheY-like chemotaxis protein